MPIIIVGTGFAGTVVAERLAKSGFKVEMFEKREHIAGNMYDFEDENGILCHKYGPHLFRTNNEDVWKYISGFGKWYSYPNLTSVLIDGKFVYQPFNLNAIETLLGKEKALLAEAAMTKRYGKGAEVPVLELLNSGDDLLVSIANFFYEKDYKPYTQKQWGLSPIEVDPSVTARVPIRNSRDNHLFLSKYKYLPSGGYTRLFGDMLNSPNININLSTDAFKYIHVDIKTKQIYVNGKVFTEPLVYTGEVDRLLSYCFGPLAYRSLEFSYENHALEWYQPSLGVVYPDSDIKFTRIIEYKHISENKTAINNTVIVKEYPVKYERTAEKGNIPYYPLMTESASAQYNKYKEALKDIPNLHLVGRLAEYKYYNMDQVIAKALEMAENIKAGMYE